MLGMQLLNGRDELQLAILVQAFALRFINLRTKLCLMYPFSIKLLQNDF